MTHRLETSEVRHADELSTRSDLNTEIARLKQRCGQLEAQLSASTYSSITSPLSHSIASSSASHSTSTGIPPSLTPKRARSDLIQRVLIRLLTKEQDAGSSLRGTIGRQLGAAVPHESSSSSKESGGSLWPSREIAEMLVDRYFDLSYGIIQFVSRSTIQAE